MGHSCTQSLSASACVACAHELQAEQGALQLAQQVEALEKERAELGLRLQVRNCGQSRLLGGAI